MNICQDDFKIIAFDFWDTIVHRDCAPEEVLFEWAKKCSIFLKFKITPSALYNLRKRSEIIGKEITAKEELEYVELIKRVYDKIECDCSFEAFYNYSLDCEINIELQHSVLDDDIIGILEYYKSIKSDIYIISDFYIGKILIEKVLSKYKILEYFKKIYVSSDISYRKSTANLYKYVCKDIGCELNHLLMIGDNRISDIAIPKSLGINTCFKEYVRHERNVVYNQKQIAMLYKEEAFGKNLEHSLNGYLPEILYFISGIHKYVVQNNIQHIFFCSREGQLIKELFDIYMRDFGHLSDLKTYYLYVSRKSVFVASLEEIDSESFYIFSRQYSKITVRNFLNSLAFNEDEIMMIVDDCSIKPTDYIVFDANDNLLPKLKSSPVFRSIYDKKRIEYKNNFIKYISTFSNDIGLEIVLVDIGWKGTIQDCIQKIVGTSYLVKGLYLGLLGKEYGIQNVESKEGILFNDEIMNVDYLNILSKRYLIWEDIFVADHGPVVGYQINNNSCIPMVDNSDSELILYKYISSYQQNLIVSFKKMLNVYRHSMYLPFECFDLTLKMALWNRYVYYPIVSDFFKLTRNLSRENFGEIDRNIKKSKKNFTKDKINISIRYYLNLFQSKLGIIIFYAKCFRLGLKIK